VNFQLGERVEETTVDFRHPSTAFHQDLRPILSLVCSFASDIQKNDGKIESRAKDTVTE
jgi:hypothetical protein